MLLRVNASALAIDIVTAAAVTDGGDTQRNTPPPANDATAVACCPNRHAQRPRAGNADVAIESNVPPRTGPEAGMTLISNFDVNRYIRPDVVNCCKLLVASTTTAPGVCEGVEQITVCVERYSARSTVVALNLMWRTIKSTARREKCSPVTVSLVPPTLGPLPGDKEMIWVAWRYSKDPAIKGAPNNPRRIAKG